MKRKIIDADFRFMLTYPDTWRHESKMIYENLFTLCKVDQAEVNRVEARLVEFLRLRDEYAEQRRLGLVA